MLKLLLNNDYQSQFPQTIQGVIRTMLETLEPVNTDFFCSRGRGVEMVGKGREKN